MNLWKRLSPEARMPLVAILGAAIGWVTYELIYMVVTMEPRATTAWILAYAIGIARQHALHRWLTFGDHGPYLPSLGRAYVMYSASFLVGAALDWVLTERFDIPHRIAWFACLVTTATISFVFLKRFVFRESPSS